MWAWRGFRAVLLGLLMTASPTAWAQQYVFHRADQNAEVPDTMFVDGTWDFGRVVKEQTAVAELAVSLIGYNTFDVEPDTNKVKFVFADAADRLVFGTQINVEFSGDTVKLDLKPDPFACFPGFCAYFPSTAPFTVSFKPNTRAPFQDTLVFKFIYPIPQTVKLPIKGEGIGFLKFLNAQGQPRDSVRFTVDSTRVGDSLPGSGFPIRVLNTSASQLGKVEDVVMSDPSMFHIVNPQLEIQPGEIGILSVQFTPQRLNTDSGYAKVVSDDFAIDTAFARLTGTGVLSLDYFTNDDTVDINGEAIHLVIDSLVVRDQAAGTRNDSLIFIQNRLNQNVEVELSMKCGRRGLLLLSEFGQTKSDRDTIFYPLDFRWVKQPQGDSIFAVQYRRSYYRLGDTILAGCYDPIVVDSPRTIVPVVVSRTLPLNDSMRVLVRFDPQTRGTFDDSIETVFLPFIDTTREWVTGYLPLRGTAFGPGLSWSRDSIDFGPLTPGLSLRDSIKLMNDPVLRGTLPVTVTIDTAGLDPVFTLLSESNFTFLPNDSFYIVWRDSAVDALVHIDTVRVNSNDPNHPFFDLILVGGTQAPVVRTSPTSINFGDVVVSDSAQRTFYVRNTGLVTLNVSGMTVSRPTVFTPSPTAFSVAPGDSQAVTVRFVPAAPLAYPDSLRVLCDDPKRPTAFVPITAGGSDPVFGATGSFLTFGVTTLNSGALVDSVGIKNLGTRGSLRVGVSLTLGTYFDLVRPDDTLIFVNAGATYWLAVRFRQAIPAVVTDSLVFVTNDKATGTAYIGLSGGGFFKALRWVSGPLADTTAYQYGKVSTLVTDTLTSVMSNTGNDTLKVLNISLFDGTQGFKRVTPGATPDSGGILQNERFDVTVTFRPSGAGLFVDTMLIVTNDTTSGNDSIVVPLEATGYVPGLQTIASLGFDTTAIGTTALDSVPFYNPGQQAVNITSAAMRKGQRFAVAGAPGSVAPDDTAYVRITFSPVDTITYYDTLRVVTSNPAGTFLVAVAGSGAGGRYADDVTQLLFPPTPIFSTSQRSFRVFNVGNRPLRVTSIAPQNPGSAFRRLSPAGLDLGAGEEATVTIGFLPLSSGAFADTLLISTSDASNSTVRIPVFGQTPDADLNFTNNRLNRIPSPQVDIGGVPVAGFSSKNLYVWNVGLDTLTMFGAELVRTGTPFTIVRGQWIRTIVPGDSMSGSIRYDPAQKGVDTNYLAIYSDDPDQDTVYVMVTARAVSGQLKILSADSSVDFGVIKVRTVDTSAQVSVQNTFGARVRLSFGDFLSGGMSDYTTQYAIHRVGGTRNFISWDPSSLPTLGRDSIISFRWIYHPADTGTDASIFRVIGTPDNSGDTINIPVSGRGSAPAIVVTPTFLDYGTLTIPPPYADSVRDTVRMIRLDIRNLGADTLYIDTLYPTNARAAHYNDATVGNFHQSYPWIIPPGQLRNFGVTVKVLARRVYYDTLALVNNDPDSDPFRVYTRVVGTAPGDVGFIDTVRISDYEATGTRVTVPLHYVFDQPIKRFSVPLKYSSDVYEIRSVSFTGTLLENIDGLVPKLDTVNNVIAIQGSSIYGPPVDTDAFIGTVFANLIFEPRPGAIASDSSISFDTVFVPPDVAYGFQDTSLLVVMPEFVAGRLDIRTSVDDEGILPGAFVLEQNFPNPFNPTTTIAFTAPRASHVSLVVFNLLGQRIATLMEGFVTPGRYEVEWQGKDESGREVSSGIYFYHLSAEDFTETRKMVLMK